MRPWNHKLFQERTFFEHLVEYFEDYYEANPLEAYRTKDGNIQFTNTGDPLIDKWESVLAQGEVPNMWEAFSEESKEKIISKLQKAKEIGLHKLTSENMHGR